FRSPPLHRHNNPLLPIPPPGDATRSTLTSVALCPPRGTPPGPHSCPSRSWPPPGDVTRSTLMSVALLAPPGGRHPVHTHVRRALGPPPGYVARSLTLGFLSISFLYYFFFSP